MANVGGSQSTFQKFELDCFKAEYFMNLFHWKDMALKKMLMFMKLFMIV